MENRGAKQAEVLKALKPEQNSEIEWIERAFPKNMRNNKFRNEINEIKKWEEKFKQGVLNCKKSKYICHFQQYETIRSFWWKYLYW